MDSDQTSSMPRRPCPVCRESIAADAQRCIHCNEYVGKNRRIRTLASQTVTYIGLFTALLSTFYALREGYFYVQKQQQQREELRALKVVATEFEQVGSLTYAQDALQKALAVSPNDVEIKQHLFTLEARMLFEDAYWQPLLNDNQLASVKALIIDGHRLLQESLSPKSKAAIAVTIANFIQMDGSWNDRNAPEKHYKLAMTLAPDSANVNLFYGQWLAEDEKTVEQGEAMMVRATQLSPQDAFFFYELAESYADRNKIKEALQAYRKAIELNSMQTELLSVQASNRAKSELRRLLLKAVAGEDITGASFYGLDIEERRGWIEQVLAKYTNDRMINRFATDFFLFANLPEQAFETISKTVSQEELEAPVRRGNFEFIQRYQAVLAALNLEPELQSALTSRLAAYEASLSWKEYLQWGIRGQHRYKVGIRVDKTGYPQGLKVLKVFSHFPFEKAGIAPMDYIQEAGHQSVTSLDELMLVMSKFAPGDEMPLKIIRDNKPMELVLVVE